ncbi:VacJ family lipoprotein [Piscinibacter sp.]|uniref:MlaA family lipoprotein n=1 Tax=Piscinibacter sp. TaxID=1903157 RepID=UPI0039E50E16
MRRGGAALALAAALLGGCATTAPGDARGAAGATPDPWEKWNRKVFAFNEALDQRVLKPVATAYAAIVPELVRRGIDNFFGNFADVWSAANNFLQGKGTAGVYDIMRVGTNTVFGLGGVLDVATEAGLEKTREDFGQTLGVWGMGSGAYVVWPVLGPSSVRDSIGLPMDLAVSPALAVGERAGRYGVNALRLVNTRAGLLGATRVLDDIALDKYTFIRDAYLQRRRSLVFDGNEPPPEDPSAEDDDDAAAAPPAASAPPGR